MIHVEVLSVSVYRHFSRLMVGSCQWRESMRVLWYAQCEADPLSRHAGEFGYPSRVNALLLVFILRPRYSHHMANLQIRNVPDDFYERLRRHARDNNCTMSAAVLIAVERELTRWEWREHLAQRPKTDLGVEAATLLAEERSLLDIETA